MYFYHRFSYQLKILKFIFLFIFCTISAQKVAPLDSLKTKDTNDFLADDYGNIYLYKGKDFSLTKYDSLGKQQAKIMFTLPFEIQSVQNPLLIPLFSENAQQIKFLDQNLNEIQQIDLRQNFEYIKAAYIEDLQQIWLLDESMKRLVQFDFRKNKILNSFPLNIDFEEIKDFQVFENQLFVLTESRFSILNFKGEKLFETDVISGKKLSRENADFYIITNDKIQKYYSVNCFSDVFSPQNPQIVDKNSTSFFELKAGKLYLYTSK